MDHSLRLPGQASLDEGPQGPASAGREMSLVGNLARTLPGAKKPIAIQSAGSQARALLDEAR